MKNGTIAIAAVAVVSLVSAVHATTLPPERETTTLVSTMAVLPPPAATWSERAYFQAPDQRTGFTNTTSCRLAATPSQATIVSRTASCD